MSDAAFEKVTKTDKPLYGPAKLLLCGFPAEVQPKFDAVLEMAGVADTPRIWVTSEQAALPLSQLLDLPDGTGQGLTSGLPRAVVVSGIMERQLHGLMTVCRNTGMKQSLWAVLTPISETWTLQALLTELAAEHAAMARRKS